MTILLHTIIALSIFIGTILSGNPNIICLLTIDTTCKKQMVERPKSCSGCKMEKEIELNCNEKIIKLSCGISTTAKLKTCCQCSTTPPLQSAILNESKPEVSQKIITHLNKYSINTSNRYKESISSSNIPQGIHRTISSTIMLL